MTTATAEKAGAPVVVRNRFVNASAEHTEVAYDSGAVAFGTELSNIEVPAYGYLASIVLLVTIASTGNSAAVAAREDAPWNVLSSVRLSDVNGANIIGPMTGYDLFLANKYGGYAFQGDPRQSPSYSAPVAGAGATGGSSTFLLRIPVQVNPRDAYGALPNMNAASTFKINISLAALASVYSVVPNGTTSVRVRAILEAWMLPGAADLTGNPNEQAPPGVGSYQRWVKNSFTVNNGANTFRLPNVGNLIRNLVLVYRNATPARNDTTFMDPIQIMVDGVSILTHPRELQRHYSQERYGYTGTAEAAGALDTGVYAYPFCQELDGHPGYETREMYLRTNQATRLEIVGTTTAAGTLDVLTNDVIPVGSALAA